MYKEVLVFSYGLNLGTARLYIPEPSGQLISLHKSVKLNETGYIVEDLLYLHDTNCAIAITDKESQLFEFILDIFKNYII